MRKVFIPKSGGHDFQAAEEFGDLVFLCDEDQSPFEVDRIREILRRKLADASPEDFLLLSGSPSINIMAAMELIRRFGRVNMLLFHARRKIYIRRDLVA